MGFGNERKDEIPRWMSKEKLGLSDRVKLSHKGDKLRRMSNGNPGFIAPSHFLHMPSHLILHKHVELVFHLASLVPRPQETLSPGRDNKDVICTPLPCEYVF